MGVVQNAAGDCCVCGYRGLLCLWLQGTVVFVVTGDCCVCGYRAVKGPVVLPYSFSNQSVCPRLRW